MLFQVEQLKRENKLWTNDSLFLREYILVPVAREDVSKLSEDCELVEIDPVNRSRTGSQISNSSQKSNNSVSLSNSADFKLTKTGTESTSSKPGTNSTENKNVIVTSDSSERSPGAKVKDDSAVSALDFLNKYDTSIAGLKTNVEKLEKNAR